jgi:hypothetical protein
MSIGASPDESEIRRSGRRVFILAFILAGVLSIPPVIARFDAGYTWVGVVDLVTSRSRSSCSSSSRSARRATWQGCT